MTVSLSKPVNSDCTCTGGSGQSFHTAECASNLRRIERYTRHSGGALAIAYRLWRDVPGTWRNVYPPEDGYLPERVILCAGSNRNGEPLTARGAI